MHTLSRCVTLETHTRDLQSYRIETNRIVPRSQLAYEPRRGASSRRATVARIRQAPGSGGRVGADVVLHVPAAEPARADEAADLLGRPQGHPAASLRRARTS